MLVSVLARINERFINTLKDLNISYLMCLSELHLLKRLEFQGDFSSSSTP